MNKQIQVVTNIPCADEWFKDFDKLFNSLDYPIELVFDETIESCINSSNVYFKCNAPNGKAIVAACNSLFRALLSLSVAIEGEQVIKL